MHVYRAVTYKLIAIIYVKCTIEGYEDAKILKQMVSVQPKDNAALPNFNSFGLLNKGS